MVLGKNRERALKAWETMRARGYVKKKKEVKKVSYNNPKKQKQREVMIKLMHKYLGKFEESNPLRMEKNSMARGIYLESPELLFTKMIDKADWKTKLSGKIFFQIPNNKEFEKFNISRDAGNIYGQYGIQYKPHLSGAFYEQIENIILVKSSYKQLIERYGEEDRWSHFFIWGDYCGSFSTFSEDIELTFSKNILGINSIYALTFSVRDMAKKNKLPKYSETNCMVAVNDFVLKVASKFGYDVELLPESGCYKSSMYTAIFYVKNKYLEKSVKNLDEMLKNLEDKKREIEYQIEKLKIQSTQTVLNLGVKDKQNIASPQGEQ